MDFASPLIELVNNVWGLARQPLGYICNLRDNVNSLRKVNEELKAQSRDVKTRVESKERGGGGVQRTNEVAKWLDDVPVLEGRVDQVLREAEERDGIRCLSRCLPQNCCSSYRLGKKVDQMLKEARNLQKKKGEFGDLTLPLPPPPVIGMPMDETMGLDTSLDEVWKWLVDEKQGGVIGLYGPGGVGKTTLMKKINEKISCENLGFEVVIWVVVSRQVSKEAIQDTIRKRLRIKDDIWSGWSREEKVYYLSQALTQKKFLLLIDDLWGWLDLLEIGVPNEPQNGSKIVFTTRQKQICDQMGAKKTSFAVQCLTPKEALELFEKKAGESIIESHPEIQELAIQMAKECKGLPLALITVRQAMAGIDNPREWEHELETLRRRPYKIEGMLEEVYHVLEFSYNRLNDCTHRRCFLYCYLFPEDYLIRPHDLIRLWIGEGLVRDTHDVYSLRNEGESVLGRLSRACLLESEHDYYGEAYAKMHDVVRDMAMWIARDHGQNEQKWLVIERQEDLMISNWRDTEKVSIWGERIVNINQIHLGHSQLKTLIIRETKVGLVPTGFFNSKDACLTVLDLSDNRYIKSLPEDICTLINLEYLNLSGTCIQKLPRDIDNLINLRWLLLESMNMGIQIPKGAIARLPLNVLSMWNSVCLVKEKEKMELEMVEKEKEKMEIDVLDLERVMVMELDLLKIQMEEREKEKMEIEMVEELGRMQNLADLSIIVYASLSVKEIFQSQNLQKSIRRVRILVRYGLKHIEITHSLRHLEILDLEECHELVLMKVNDGIDPCFPSLSEVQIVHCGLSDLSWLVHAPELRKLTVMKCPEMEKIIGDGFAPEKLTASRLFSRLKSVELWELPKLTSICNEALSFAPEVLFYIYECPGLKKLPLDSSSARGGGFSIQAHKGWWATFEWDPAARVIYDRNVSSQGEEMTYGEARQREVEGFGHPNVYPFISMLRMIFLPDGKSE